MMRLITCPPSLPPSRPFDGVPGAIVVDNVTLVSGATKDGPTSQALLAAGLCSTEGLRIVTINGVHPQRPVTPASCAAEISKSPICELGVVKDADAFAYSCAANARRHYRPDDDDEDAEREFFTVDSRESSNGMFGMTLLGVDATDGGSIGVQTVAMPQGGRITVTVEAFTVISDDCPWNGATARALLKAGLDPEDGLRIVTINGVAPAGPITPAACIAEMAKSPVAEFGPSS